MGINFLPDMKGYTGQQPFRFWCQTVLPLVYDDSLSYYELLNKVVFYLNNVISDVSNVEDNVTSLYEAFGELQDYVNHYFDTLDISSEIDRKLDEMALDGSLASAVQPIISAQVAAWLAEHVTPTTPAIDDSLTIEGAGADAYATGVAIYGVRNHEDVRTYSNGAYTKYNSEDFTDIADMPNWSYFMAIGSTIQAKLNENFIWTLQPNLSYFVQKISTVTRQNSAAIYFIFSIGGTELYWGNQLAGEEVPTPVKWRKFKIPQGNTYYDTLLRPIYKYCYNEYERIPGWWEANGNLGNLDGYYHTQFYRVNPGDTLYFGYTNLTVRYLGYFFDENKEPVSAVYGATATNPSIEEYVYDSPSIVPYAYGNYETLYKCTVPAGCYYVSMNISRYTEMRNCMSNVPSLVLTDTGDVIRYGPEYSDNKKLGIIGPSTVMIDRLYRSEISGYIRGFQEYLVPYFKAVKSYGLSNGSWFERNGESIYTEVVTNQLQTDCDTFLIMSSSNGINDCTVGDPDDSDPTTYFGGINGTIDYLYNLCGKFIKIYLSDIPHGYNYYHTTGRKAKVDEINAKYEQLSSIRGIELIKFSETSGINEDNCAEFTYDNTHWNQEGNRVIGQLLVRKLVK